MLFVGSSSAWLGTADVPVLCFLPQVARCGQGGGLQQHLRPGAGPPAAGLQRGGLRGDGSVAHPRAPGPVARLEALRQRRGRALLWPAGHPERVHLQVHGALPLRAVERHRRDHHAVPTRRPDVPDERAPRAAPKRRIYFSKKKNVHFMFRITNDEHEID